MCFWDKNQNMDICKLLLEEVKKWHSGSGRIQPADNTGGLTY